MFNPLHKTYSLTSYKGLITVFIKLTFIFSKNILNQKYIFMVIKNDLPFLLNTTYHHISVRDTSSDKNRLAPIWVAVVVQMGLMWLMF